MKYRLKHIVEYAALRGMAGLVRIMPYRVALTKAWVLAWIGFHLVRFRRREAERRIREVFGTRYSDREVRQIAWVSLRNLCFTAVDVMRTPYATLESLAPMTDYEGLIRAMTEQHAAGRGAICALPHMGAWEMPARALLLRGLPFFSVTGKQRNPLFDRYVNVLRERSGLPITVRGASTLRAIITQLKAGGMFAVLPDVRMRTGGIKIRFLGKEANLGAGMASFARHAEVPIYPLIVTRVGWARHAVKVFPPIYPDPSLDKTADIQRMTQQVMDIITQAIHNDPSQWFWYNKRWVLEPV